MISARLAWMADDPDRDLEGLARQLGAGERLELQALQQPWRRRHFLLSRVLLRHLLAETTGCSGEALGFQRIDGRLALTAPAGWHISLSHADGFIAAAVATAPCGVDIERPRKVDIHKLARRYFATAEADWLAAADDATARQDFFRLWTLKEASAKALGQGLAHNLARLAFSLVGPVPVAAASTPALAPHQEEVAGGWLAAAVATPEAVDWRSSEIRLNALMS